MTAGSVDALQRVGSLAWYGRILGRRARWILALAFGLAVTGGLLSLLRSREYVATARFRALSASGGGQGALGSIGQQLGLASLSQQGDPPEFYIGLLRSRGMLKDLGSRIYTVPGNSPFKGDLYAFYKIAADGPSARNIKLVDVLEKKIETSVERTTGVVTVQVHTTNPTLSEQMSVTLLGLLDEYDINRRREQARAERQFVEQRLSDERAALTADEDALTSFYTRNRQLVAGRPTGSAELNAEESRLERRVQFRQELYLSLAQNLSKIELEEARDTPTLTVLERPGGFIEPRPRGTLRLATLLFIFGLVVGAGWAIVREYLTMVKASGLQVFEPENEPSVAPRRRTRQSGRGDQTSVARSAE
jgi:uncharacterized protein involved in exopolysaccharide biosynthesis